MYSSFYAIYSAPPFILPPHLSPFLYVLYLSPSPLQAHVSLHATVLICNRSSICQRGGGRTLMCTSLSVKASYICNRFINCTLANTSQRYRTQLETYREVIKANAHHRCTRWAWLKCFYILICRADPAGYNLPVSLFYLPIFVPHLKSHKPGGRNWNNLS